MTKTKKVLKGKVSEIPETPVGEVNIPEVDPVVEEPVGEIRKFDDHGGFKIDINPNDSPKVKKAKLKAIFAADKAQNPERYARKNKDAELERKLKAL